MSRLSIIKYSIYSLVMINLCYYAYLDAEAVKQLPLGFSLGEIARGFGSTIDYVAWMILLAIFELETAFRGSRAFGKVARNVAYGISAVCYLALVFAAENYVTEYRWYSGFEERSSEKICELIDDGYSLLDKREAYVVFTAENCLALEQGPVFEHTQEKTLVSAEALTASSRLGLASAANGLVWLLLLLLMQGEISYNQSHGSQHRRPLFFRGTKAVLYLVLFANAAYWIFFGNWIDGWDASLWLFAFLLLDIDLVKSNASDGLEG